MTAAFILEAPHIGKAWGIRPEAEDDLINRAAEFEQRDGVWYHKVLDAPANSKEVRQFYETKTPHWWVQSGGDDLEQQAFGPSANMTARSKLVSQLGERDALARAQAWGLSSFTVCKPRPPP